MSGELKRVAIEKLTPHPDNPRVVMREDVVSALAAGMNGEYPKKHAIHVRPHGDGYQILSGHTRTEAARRKGFTHVWAWVEDLDDRAAFMELVTSNNQGELDPLEIGIHVFLAVPPAQGKKGKGLTEYAKQIGKTQPYVSQLRDAGEVLAELHKSTYEVDRTAFLGRAQHLCAIRKLIKSFWPVACQWLAEAISDAADDGTRGPSVADVEERVDATLDMIKTFDPRGWKTWLPPHRCAEAVLRKESTKADFKRLLDIADEVHQKLAKYEDLQSQWVEWLEANSGFASWDTKKVRDKRDEFEDLAWKREQAELTEDDRFQVHACDFRKAPVEPDSLDLIITDPPYPEEFVPLYGDLSEFAARTLKPGGSLFVMCGHCYLDRVLPLLCKHLTYHWTLAYLTPGGQSAAQVDRKVNTFWKPVFWLTKGKYAGDWIGDVTKSAVNDNDKNHHHWGQSESGMADLVSRVSKPGDRVCDPFLGGGTTGVVATKLGRLFTGVELDAGVAEAARKRIQDALAEDPAT